MNDNVVITVPLRMDKTLLKFGIEAAKNKINATFSVLITTRFQVNAEKNKEITERENVYLSHLQ